MSAAPAGPAVFPRPGPALTAALRRAMEPARQTLPLENASILSEGSLQDGHRLWIGNLDPKITE